MSKLIQGGILTKEQLLKDTKGGLLLLIILFGDDFKLIDNGTKAKKLRNPFYNDKNPALSFYLGNLKIWRFKDFGDSSFEGDIFDFFAIYFKLEVVKDFPLLLEKMNELFKSKEVELPKLREIPELPKKEVLRLEILSDGFNKQGLEYWKQYGITKKMLDDNLVFQVYGYVINYTDGTTENKTYKKGSLIFAYKYNDKCYKFYSPNPKWFRYAGDKPRDFILGQIHDWSEIDTPMFICGGNKDALTVRSVGFESITLSSETATMPKSVVKQLYEGRYKPVILYDNDATGRKQAKLLAESCSGIAADLSSILTEEEKAEIKDVADFVKSDLEINRIRLFKFLMTFVPEVDSFVSENDFFFEEHPELLSVLNNIEDNDEGPFSDHWSNDDTYHQQLEEEKRHMLEQHGVVMSDDGSFENEEQTIDEEDSKLDILGLDPDLYEKLPEFLKAVTEPLSEPHEKDLVLISAITVLGNVFKISGIYDNRRMYSNLMAFITAPASAGKGAMKFSKILGKSFDDYHKSIYDAEMEVYKLAKKNKEEPDKPARKRFFLSGNSSTAAMINSLYNSNGKGAILEYEADVLNNTYANKTWGDFSTVLRNAFEHETITKHRVDDEIDIECPRLSVAISGTKNQLFEFIPSVENGLFSRFMFYEFPLIPVFKNVFAKKVDLAEYYGKLSEDLFKFHDNHEEVEFKFESHQEEKFLEYFTKNHDTFYALLGKDSLSIVRRLGSMCFRIAMIISISKYVYEESTPVEITCSDEDFEIALSMVGTFIRQAEKLFLTLPKSDKRYEVLKTNEQKLLESVNDDFTFNQILDQGEQLDIAKGTIERYLRKYIKYNLVDRYKQGHYRKINK